MDICITPAKQHDLSELLYLYKLVATQKDGIIRNEEEITEAYITNFLKRSLKKGLILLAKSDTEIIGEIHAYIPNIFAFRHILSDLTIVVHPDYQGMGVGRNLFKQLAWFNPFFDPEFVKQS